MALGTIELTMFNVSRLTIDPLETLAPKDDLPGTSWRRLQIDWHDNDGVMHITEIVLHPSGTDIEIATGNVELTKALP